MCGLVKRNAMMEIKSMGMTAHYNARTPSVEMGSLSTRVRAAPKSVMMGTNLKPTIASIIASLTSAETTKPLVMAAQKHAMMATSLMKMIARQAASSRIVETSSCTMALGELSSVMMGIQTTLMTAKTTALKIYAEMVFDKFLVLLLRLVMTTIHKQEMVAAVIVS